MTELQEHIDEVMDWFDFDRVYRCMTALGWTWHDEGVPDIPVLRATVRRLMKDAYGLDEGGVVSTGGLWVKYDKEYNYFDVKFVVTDWDTYKED